MLCDSLCAAVDPTHSFVRAVLGKHLSIRAAQPAHEALTFRRGEVLLLRNKVNLVNVPTDCFRTVCKRQSAKQVCGSPAPGPTQALG